MIGRDQDAIIALALQEAVHGPDDVGIDPLESFDLFVGVPLVRCLITGFHVHDDEVHVFQRFDRVTPLGRVIGVEITRRSRARQ